ncbi:uncharacterized protein LOC128548362 isoform X2 [Mercenaria mercenaria]|uniref:uncharacterized protein LOC128548362 isoform X2 n=1 Tax=Mercenaria mercenaria TaxID=6596 RepID=UPI00234EA4E8|nr:uncharacterized protein LOC128548362 isoform X2 [Mercenaria mercenaria]
MALDLFCVRVITQGICFTFKSSATFHFLFINILLLSHLPHIVMETKPDILQSENMTDLSGKMQTWKISNMPYEQLKQFQDLLEIMEKLDVLNLKGNKTGCFYLEKVVRDVTFPEKSYPRIGIHFYFDEAQIISDSSSSKIVQDKNIVSEHFSTANGHLKTGDCKSNPLLPDTNGLDRLSRKQDDKNQNLTNDNTSNNNLTGSSGAKQMVEENTSQNDRHRGLSRTQVIVIATCSAVIGTFFIIAGAMRINSCMKRYRANREAALVIARRTSAFGFGGSGNLRRDSASSKASRQQSHPTSKNGSDIQIDRNGRSQPPISHNSPQHSSDHNPLLPVHLVGQFSDGNSSHGSLAYIDEESHSRSKNNNTSGSEFGSEDDPLLRKSPDSGSSIDICMEADDKVNVKEEHMKLSSETLKDSNCTSPDGLRTTPERKEVFEPGGDTDSEININMPVETHEKETCNYTINENEISNSEDNVKEENNANTNTELINSANGYAPERHDEDKKEESILTKESEPAKELENMSKTEDSIPGRIDTCPRKQFSVDYFDVDDNGIEIQNPIFEEMDDAEPYGHLSENQVVTTGLTQSDSSLSNNPSYSYGNQAEYSYVGGYGQAGYFCPYLSNTDNNIKCLDSSFIHNSLRNSAFLSAETLRRENGELQNESFDDSSLSGNSRKSSLIDDIDKAKYPRMYSTDSYFAGRLNRTSPFERTCPEDIEETGTKSTDITTSTRKPHIIPLHEYHRNSLKGTIDKDDGV